jgi:hypothetical protein
MMTPVGQARSRCRIESIADQTWTWSTTMLSRHSGILRQGLWEQGGFVERSLLRSDAPGVRQAQQAALYKSRHATVIAGRS